MARVIATGTDLDALRARLRSGNLPEELLKPGPEVVLRAGDRRLTRKELRAEAEQVAGGLQQLGVKPGDRVAIYAASSLDWVIAYLGLQRAGAALVPMNSDYHSAEAEHILNDSDPTLVIADAPRAAIAHGLGRRVISVDELPRQDDQRGTMLFGVPAMYQRLCDWLDEHPADLSHVRVFVSGSAPLPPAMFERCERLLGQKPIERYGITEGGIVVTNPYDGPRQPGRVGLPFPGVEVRLGEKDEVQLKGGQVFKGYWRNPNATEEAFTPDGFFKTADVGEIGEDGTLAIRGRLKELIISGGFNVYPREVELVLEEHPAVQEVAVAGVPSEKWGEEVTAFVVPSGSEPLIESELIAFAQERLASYKCPRRVVVLDKLPRNAMGKVEKSKLTAR